MQRFIKKFSDGIKAKKDPFTKEDYEAVNSEYQRKEEYIEDCDKNLIRIDLNGHRVGVSISELYRSDVGNRLSLKYQDELDYILIINFMRNQFSFRTVREDINVGQISKGFTKDGGGHPKAGGMPINLDTLFILDLVRDAIRDKEEMKLIKKQP